jgi:hypothetical protein
MNRRTLLCPWALFALVVVLTLPTLPRQAVAQGIVGGFGGPPPTTPYLSADGSFALRVPGSWAVKEQRGQRDRVTLRSLYAPDAFIEVRRMAVSAGARPKQLVLIAKDARLSKLPHYHDVVVREMSVGGVPAASIMGSYWYQGNVQFPRAVEELFLVNGNEAYVFHFECFEPMAQALAPDVGSIYASFVSHPVNAPAAPAGDDEGDVWDKIPF